MTNATMTKSKFLEVLQVYLEGIETREKRINACNEIGAICKTLANNLQQAMKKTPQHQQGRGRSR
jgi:hypothetical protein